MRVRGHGFDSGNSHVKFVSEKVQPRFLQLGVQRPSWKKSTVKPYLCKRKVRSI